MSATPRTNSPRVSIVAGAIVLGAVLVTGGILPSASAATAAIVDDPITYSSARAPIELSPLGSYETGVFDESAAEIVTYHSASGRLFVVNSQAGTVEVLSLRNPSTPTKLFDLVTAGVVAADGSTLPAGVVANSVVVRADGLGAIAVESDPKTDAGWLVFFNAKAKSPTFLGAVRVGAQPDMVTISSDGRFAVSANEGEPNDDYTADPEGSVSVIELPRRLAAPRQSAVRTADFHAFEAGGGKALDPDVRIFAGIDGAPNPVSASLEPEYVAFDPSGNQAYVSLQEANAVAVVSVKHAAVTEIWPLGFKDLGVAGNGIDPSDRDGATSIRTFPGLKGVYLPDGLNSYTARGKTYLVTANEGDAREWGDYAEGARAGSLPICATSPLLGRTGNADLGRLNVTTENGFNEADGCYDELYAFGGRSFSIWTTDGKQVFDSGDQFEQITAAALPEFFNSNHTESGLEGRSDDKGPEPENLAIGKVSGRTYAFIGFERVGGIIVYDISSPRSPEFVTYLNNRDFAISMEDSVDAGTGVSDLPLAGDLGPEGLTFISAEDSPTRRPLLVVANEVSGTTTIFSIEKVGGHHGG